MIILSAMSVAATRKRSRQRELILEILRSSRAHPTAAWVFERARKKMPDLSLATVYRNLKVLQEQGLIAKLDPGAVFDRFDAFTHAHYHLICTTCGSVSDLDLPVDTEIEGRAAAMAGSFEIKSHRLEFIGLCEKCSKRSRRPVHA